jgi:hypothetical protein
MNIYDLRCDVNYKRLYLTSVDDIDRLIDHAHGIPFGDSWRPSKQKYVGPEDEGYNPRAIDGDFVSAAHEVALTAKAMAMAGELFKAWGELLPITVVDDQSTVYWFNCTTVINCLDEAHSNYLWREYEFFADRIGKADVFCVHTPRAGIFCSEYFKKKIEATGLTGLDFTLRWSDEAENVKFLKDKKLMRLNPPSELAH